MLELGLCRAVFPFFFSQNEATWKKTIAKVGDIQSLPLIRLLWIVETLQLNALRPFIYSSMKQRVAFVPIFCLVDRNQKEFENVGYAEVKKMKMILH